VSRKSAPVRFGSIKPRLPLAGSGQRVGLLGGSFNPPHDAHQLITGIARRRLGLDAVWWVVTPGNPLKSHDELLPLEERLRLSREMVSDRRVRITAFEQDLSSAYTAATLSYLTNRRPDVHFVWLMGADNLATFHRWQDWRGIAETMPIAVVDRPGWRLKGLASEAAQALRRSFIPEQHAMALPMMQAPVWTFLTGPLSTLSSTEIRAGRLMAGDG
jgi:nicotinate-nucleotide adenylyltransferase